jgi:hypothetical protein
MSVSSVSDAVTPVVVIDADDVIPSVEELVDAAAVESLVPPPWMSS